MTFEQQLEACLPKMYAHAMMLTKSKAVADELVQDTCVRALSRAHQWQQESGRLGGWLGAIMQSIWLNECRYARTRRGVEIELPDPDQVSDRNLETEVETQLMIADIRRVCVTLSEDDFALVIKIHVYGYTYRELADEAGCPIGTMLSRVSRAKASLLKAARRDEDVEKATPTPTATKERQLEYAC